MVESRLKSSYLPTDSFSSLNKYQPMKNVLLCLLLVIIIAPLKAQPPSSKALRFNGTTNYVNCGTINLSGSQVTLQGWVRVQSFKSTFPNISSLFGTEQTGNQCMLRIGDAGIPNDRVQFVIYDGAIHHKIHTNQALQTNTWYHIAATYDGSAMRIYVNGILDISLNISTSIVSNNTFEIARNYGNDRILDGSLDEVSVFTTALSQATIRDWMCRRITPSHPQYNQLEGYWPFDETTGTITSDLSGNNNNGTLVSSPLRQNSGAPVGNASKHDYGSNFDLGLSHPQGDSLHVSWISGVTQGAHVYRMDSVPYVTAAPGAIQYLDTIRQWGIFTLGNPNSTLQYYYSGNTIADGLDCQLTFASRNDASASSWTASPPSTSNFTSQYMELPITGRKEVTLGISSNGPHMLDYSIQTPNCFNGNDGEVILTVSGGTLPYTYSWETGSTTNNSGSIGSGYISVTVTDNFGCITIDSTFVDEPDSLQVYFSVTPTLCKDTNTGGATAIVLGGVGGNGFLWQNGNTTNTVTNLSYGFHTITVTDANGCTVSSAAQVGSTGPDPFPFLGNDTTLCDGTNYNLSPAIIGGPFNSFEWSTGGSSNNITITESGTYSLSVTNTAGCSGADTINVFYSPAVEVDLGPKNQSAAISLTLDAGSGFQSYQWNNLSTNQSIVVTQTGTYWVKVKDFNNCESADTVKVSIFPLGFSIANHSQISIYPNPASNILFVDGKESQLERFTVTNEIGQVVLTGNLITDKTIDISPLPSGVYFLHFKSENIASEVYRFVKN